MKYRVHIYEIVRVPIVVHAATRKQAIDKIQGFTLTAKDDDYDPYVAFRTNPGAEWAEDVDGYLVDQIDRNGAMADGESRWYTKQGELDRSMHPRSKQGDPKNKQIWAVIQEGGSSGELYFHTFDTFQQAKKYRKECEKAAYRTTPCIVVPEGLDVNAVQDLLDSLRNMD